MHHLSIACGLVAYLLRRDWWLAPAAVALVALAVFLVVAQSSILAPILYPLF
jgi:hypothetical protein